MRFYLGTHLTHWLGQLEIPLFVSRRRLIRYRTLPRATAPWALDSGGFSELRMNGRWTIRPEEYTREVRRYRDEIGQLEWAAIMDWMTEPEILRKTGLTIRDHQMQTVLNYLRLQELDPDLPWVPVIQGWDIRDYHRHIWVYGQFGIDLSRVPLVGIGSVCRRQHTQEIETILRSLKGLPLHGFGVKIDGLERAADCLVSSDSLAWSLGARRSPPLPGCAHPNCANCLKYALLWREKVLAAIERNDILN